MHGKLEPEERVMESQNYTVYSKSGCPYCSNRISTLRDSIYKLYPELCSKVVDIYSSSGVKKKKESMKQIGINSHYSLTVQCSSCNDIIKRQVREHIRLIKKSSKISYLCKNCRN